MGIANRTLDASEQKRVFQVTFPNGLGASAIVNTGMTAAIIVPFAGVLNAAQAYVGGVSGSLQVQLNVDRFIAGTGFTTIIVGKGTSNICGSYGVSGLGLAGANLLLVAAGSTLLNLVANDVITIGTLGSNAATQSLTVAVVITPIQDIKTQFGI